MNLAFDDVQARIDGTLTTLNGNLLTPILTSQDVKAAYLAHIQHRLNNYAPHHSGRTFLVTMPNKLQKNTYLSEGIKFIEPTTSQECK
jgi:hypothetical protein